MLQSFFLWSENNKQQTTAATQLSFSVTLSYLSSWQIKSKATSNNPRVCNLSSIDKVVAVFELLRFGHSGWLSQRASHNARHSNLFFSRCRSYGHADWRRQDWLTARASLSILPCGTSNCGRIICLVATVEDGFTKTTKTNIAPQKHTVMVQNYNAKCTLVNLGIPCNLSYCILQDCLLFFQERP